jgi:hypothetical protein
MVEPGRPEPREQFVAWLRTFSQRWSFDPKHEILIRGVLRLRLSPQIDVGRRREFPIQVDVVLVFVVTLRGRVAKVAVGLEKLKDLGDFRSVLG